jgi:hypothetical protein
LPIKTNISLVWWHTPIIPTPRRLWKENCKFKAIYFKKLNKNKKFSLNSESTLFLTIQVDVLTTSLDLILEIKPTGNSNQNEIK